MPKLDFYDRGPDRPWLNERLTTAAIVGHTTDTSVRLWVRVWGPAKYCAFLSEAPIPAETRLSVSQDASGAQVFKLESSGGTAQLVPTLSRTQSIDFDTDLTAVFDFDGLRAATTYYYAVFCVFDRPNRWELPPDPAQRCFRTQDRATKEVNFALFSCHMPYKKNGDVENIQMWENLRLEMESRRGDFIIGCGDQVYVDGNKRASIWEWLRKVKQEVIQQSPDEQHRIMVSWYRDIFRGFWGFPQVRRAWERFPNYMMWDDHEIVDGWGSYTPDELADKLDSFLEWQNTSMNLTLANRMFEAAQQVYTEYEHSHNPGTPAGTWDYEFRWGPVPLYMLDMRGQRNFNRATDDRVLGRDQMNRLLSWLSRDDVQSAPVVFIISPVPVVHVCSFVVNHLDLPFLGIADDLRDEWEHNSNWKERNVMLRAVFDLSERTGHRVIFLSGDVHMAASFRILHKDAPHSRVYQLTSSAISYSAFPGLQYMVRETGALGGADDGKAPYTFRQLQRVVPTNNFGMVRVDTSDPAAPEVSWQLYANTGGADEVMHLKPLKLD